ncbi:MAG TPA: extracellular solute-binding protein [Limnochordia bacterium]
MLNDGWLRRAGRVIPLGMMFAVLGPLPAGAVTLTVAGHWGPGDFQHRTFMQNAADYTALHPDVQFEYVPVGVSLERIAVLAAAGSNPDIWHVHGMNMLDMIHLGIVAPVPADIAAEIRRAFIPPAVDRSSYQGVQYGFPTENQVFGLVYHKSIFDEAGITAPPQTWDEWERAARKLKVTGTDGRVSRYGLTFYGTGYAEGFTYSFLSLLWSNGGRYINDDGIVTLAQPPAIQTLDMMARLIREQVALFDGNGAVERRQAAMGLLASWSRNGLAAALGDDYAQVRSTFIPHGSTGFAAANYNWMFLVFVGSPAKDQAFDFLRWLTMEPTEHQTTRMGDHMAALGSLPVHRLDFANQTLYKEDTGFYGGYIASIPYIRPEPKFPETDRRQREWAAALTPVFSGNTSPQTGLENAARAVQEIIDQYR